MKKLRGEFVREADPDLFDLRMPEKPGADPAA